MEQKWYKEKIENILQDLLVDIHQSLNSQNVVNLTKVELLKELNSIYSSVQIKEDIKL